MRLFYACNDKLTAMHVNVNMVFEDKKYSCFVYDIVWTTKAKESERKAHGR